MFLFYFSLQKEDLEQMMGNGPAHLSHKFFRADESFFIDAVRISPFPAEAIAQLQALAGLPDLASFDILDAAGWIFDQGTIYRLLSSGTKQECMHTV